ncbi:MAG: hypothetical protein GX608_13175, partial [Lentisphaerae bacterium]|nr:hypothetical protein [Lentisphaerota bacterium]
GYVPAPGDYNGDGRWDMAVYHELTGIWYARDVAGEWLIAGLRWGGPGFLPLQ